MFLSLQTLSSCPVGNIPTCFSSCLVLSFFYLFIFFFPWLPRLQAALLNRPLFFFLAHLGWICSVKSKLTRRLQSAWALFPELSGLGSARSAAHYVRRKGTRGTRTGFGEQRHPLAQLHKLFLADSACFFFFSHTASSLLSLDAQ